MWCDQLLGGHPPWASITLLRGVVALLLPSLSLDGETISKLDLLFVTFRTLPSCQEQPGMRRGKRCCATC